MAEEWQDALLSTRHSHNRTSKFQERGKAKSKATFTPTSAFGSYNIICKKVKSQEGSPEDGAFEILNLTKCGRGFHVELRFGDALSASGIMAPSRKILAAIQTNGNERQEESPDADSSADDAEDSDDSEEGDDSDGEEETSSSIFEKNTFRVPKFWLGLDFRTDSEEKGENAKSQDVGYIVFSHNDCRKFSGTLSCQTLTWDNVPVQGRKITSRPARDFVAVV